MIKERIKAGLRIYLPQSLIGVQTLKIAAKRKAKKMNRVIKSVSLFFCAGNSDKEYHTQLVEATGGYSVEFQYGRRGSSLNSGTKTPEPLPIEGAQKIYDRLVAEKTGKGYVEALASQSDSYEAPTASQVDVFVPQLLMPIDEVDLEKYLKDDGYGAQEKLDGVHKTAKREGSTIIVRNKKGKSVGFSDVLKDDLLKMDQDAHLDMEAIGDNYYVFDMMEFSGENLKDIGYGERHDRLAASGIGSGFNIVPLIRGYKAKKEFFEKLKEEGKEGIVFKKLSAPYQSSIRNETMIKHKFYSTLSARVCKGREGKNSIGLELLDDRGEWKFMGFCTVSAAQAPTIPMGSICEIRYLYVQGKEGHLYQPCFKEIRSDVDESECLMSQIKYKSEED
jgi:bifunctional non-homologous end joining protein LigD